MNVTKQFPDMKRNLRRLAEEKAAPLLEIPYALSPEETRKMLRELRVHQVELEMQNEELQRSHAELDRARARYFDLYDLAPVGYVTISEKGLIREANLTAAELLGVARSALMKQPLSHYILLEDQDIYYRHRQELFKTKARQTFEIRLIRPDSTCFWARMEATLAMDKAAGICLCRCTLSDITDRKGIEAEQAKLKDQLNQAQKMASIGRLAGGVAHDFNNKLAVILGYAESAMEQVSPADTLYSDIEEIRRAAIRSADLIQQLLTYACKQIITPWVLNLNVPVERVLPMLSCTIGEDIELVWEPGNDLWPVKVDPMQVEQLLSNLAANTRDAICGKGKLVVQTCNTPLDESFCADHHDCTPGEYVLLSVSDTGSGMEPDVLAHVFEPFFTTKGVGKGVGLGLSTVYGIVTQNHGCIHASSAPGKGTTFRIYLPRVHERNLAKLANDKNPGLAGGTETVLIVENEEAILKLAECLLKRLGYSVLKASSPEQALNLIASYPEFIHLLITDVVMPEMNGRELSEKIAALKPGVRCLYMTGYTAQAITDRGVLSGGVSFMNKPFTIRELAGKVREVLDR